MENQTGSLMDSFIMHITVYVLRIFLGTKPNASWGPNEVHLVFLNILTSFFW